MMLESARLGISQMAYTPNAITHEMFVRKESHKFQTMGGGWGRMMFVLVWTGGIVVISAGKRDSRVGM